MKKMAFVVIASLIFSFGVKAVENEVKPLCKTQITFTAGIAGKAALFKSKSRFLLPLECIKANCGTIEMWLNTETPKKGYVPLVSVGKNNPMWFLAGFDNKAINFLYKRKEGKKFKYYTSLKQACAFENKWTHFALVWAYNGAGRSLVQIYINGKSIMDKYNTTTGQKWVECRELGIGCNTASALAPALVGAIDELRISNYPKTPSEIKKAFEHVKAKRELKVEAGTLLLNNFNDTLTGKSMTKETLNAEKVSEYVEKILNELYPED